MTSVFEKRIFRLTLYAESHIIETIGRYGRNSYYIAMLQIHFG